jgi:hypothetical protein
VTEAAGARRWVPWALFAAGLLVSGCTMLRDIQPNDEGLMSQAAARIADGQVPYRDFWWFYPPGQPYLLGGLHALFGPSLLPWRVVRVLADATVALLAWRLASRAASPRLALVAWAAAILAMAYPGGPHPFPIALALALGALLTFERRPVLAGVLTGACAAWRIEFAVFAAAGIVLAQRPPWRYLAATAGTAALLFAPVVIAAGLGRSWNLLVDYPLTDFRDYQALPFPLDYDGPLNTGSVGGFLSDSAEPLLLFYLPFVLVVGVVAAAFALVRRRDALTIATAVFTAGTVGYLLVRTDLFHTAPLAVMFAVLAAWALASRSGVVAVVVGVALAFVIVEGADRRWLGLREDTVPVADGVRAPPAEAAELKAAVRAVQRAVPPGEPIYVAPKRADQVTAGYPLLYVVADRPNPTRYDIAAPGVVTSAPVQREIVRDLERTKPRVVVRWESPLSAAPEPNAAGRSSGVRLLDDYLARAYEPGPRYGTLRMLLRRP